MRRSFVPMFCLLGLAAPLCLAADDDGPSPANVVVASPGGQMCVEVALGQHEGQAGVPLYRVFFKDRPVVLSSRLGVGLAPGSGLGNGSIIERARLHSVFETYTQFPGKRSRVVNHCREAVITLRERAAPGWRWELVVRAYDDGVAFRYGFPAQEGWTELRITGERTAFRLPDDALAYSLPLNSFTSSHEARYTRGPIAKIPVESILGLPLLAELPGTGWVAITEAQLDDYAGMYLARDGASLVARLSPRPGEPHTAVRADLPHRSPWRVLMIVDRVERLIESDLVLNLNAPSALTDTGWIRPGKTTFPWWNGFYERDVPFKMGLNTATAKYYIDFCAEAGIPYHSLDGLDNVAWYGGPIVPYEGADITRGIDGLDLQEVLRYARSKGVRLRLWMHWKAAEKHMERAFPLYREWGIEGVMLDFMDRDDQEMVKFLHKAVKLAADNRLTVTLHGVGEPTGLERTFPNLLTHEGVLNLEYDKWDKLGVSPEHELTVPFTRMLAGPLDFHQGSLRGVSVDEFRPRNAAPLVMGTPCRMLASYVVIQNHLPMVADYPSSYRGHPGLGVLAKIPVTWDDTRCLSGTVGEQIVMARRSGDDWWIGAMNDRHTRPVEVKMSFLGTGRYRARAYRDNRNDHSRIAESEAEITADYVVRENLGPAGGLLIHVWPSSLK